jgi:hypothetical protein
MTEEFEEFLKKYQHTQVLSKRRPILSEIVERFGRDKASAICKLEDVEWLRWYYWELPSMYESAKMPIDKISIFGWCPSKEGKNHNAK